MYNVHLSLSLVSRRSSYRESEQNLSHQQQWKCRGQVWSHNPSIFGPGRDMSAISQATFAKGMWCFLLDTPGSNRILCFLKDHINGHKLWHPMRQILCLVLFHLFKIKCEEAAGEDRGRNKQCPNKDYFFQPDAGPNIHSELNWPPAGCWAFATGVTITRFFIDCIPTPPNHPLGHVIHHHSLHELLEKIGYEEQRFS